MAGLTGGSPAARGLPVSLRRLRPGGLLSRCQCSESKSQAAAGTVTVTVTFSRTRRLFQVVQRLGGSESESELGRSRHTSRREPESHWPGHPGRRRRVGLGLPSQPTTRSHPPRGGGPGHGPVGRSMCCGQGPTVTVPGQKSLPVSRCSVTHGASAVTVLVA